MKPQTGLWLNTPPAIFPPILGLFGLGLDWRRAPSVFAIPDSLGEAILGAVSLLFLFALVAYLAKIARRPGALIDDLRIMPGRAGVANLSMAAMLLAAALTPYGTGLAQAVLGVAMAAHFLGAGIVLAVLWRAPYPQRRVSPVWHLTFVGMIVGPVAGVGLGWSVFSQVVLFASIAAAITIWGASLSGPLRAPVPAPLRPPLAIHLSPAALIGIVAAQLGYDTLALAAGWLSIAILALLLVRLRYLTAAGFSPLWGAFTFPLAAFANLMLLLTPAHGALFRVLAGGALIVASISIPIIALTILKMWASGPLAVKTNASHV